MTMPTVLLLGASSDIAAALAKKYASRGFDIQLAARHAGRLAPFVSDLFIRYGARTTLHEFDALQFGHHREFWANLEPKPDITICAFGYLGEQTIAQSNWTECEKIIHTNYTAAISILNIVAEDYAAAGKGTIAGISSVAGERGRGSNYLYGSAKAGFTAYLSGLRNRLSSGNVHVLTVKPGFVYTRMTEGMPLPAPLTANPRQVADAVYNAIEKKKNTLFVKWFWRWIMLMIKSIPESMFKKLKW
jgi:decaprenylphospho-beta-D-erythro-pentofuranosid-2-ulose 2-reductase